MQVDRAVMDDRVRPRRLDGADQLTALGLHDRHRVRRRRAQRDLGRGIARAARQVAPAALAQATLLDEPARVLLPARPEHVLVLGRQRQLVGGGGEVGEVNLLRLVVEDRPFDRALEELVGVTAEELVERVLARHIHGEAGLAATRPPPHLSQRRHRAREGHADRRVELAHVDAELEGIRGHHGQQLPLRQAALDLAPLRGRVAGAVGRDALGEVGPARVLEAQAREALDQLDPAPRPQEADRAHLALDQSGQQHRGLRQRGGALAEPLVHERRVPHHHLALGVRRSVAVHERHLDPGQALGQLLRVGDRGARQHEPGLGAVGAGEAAQAPQHVRHMRAEHAAIHVGLVDDNPGQVGEHVAPGAVVGEHPHVEHVRIGEDQVGARADRAALLARGIAVVDRVAQEAPAELRELARLVLGERLGGVEVEGARRRVARERVEHRQVERQRLAAGGARGHDRVPAPGLLEHVGLVGPERVDSAGAQGVSQRRVDVGGDRRGHARARFVAGRRDHLILVGRLEQRVPAVSRSHAGHGLR